MNEMYEAVKGFTDLPIAAVSLILGIAALIKKHQRENAFMFFTISVGAVLGALVHIVNVGDTGRKIIWTPLYLILIEAIRLFSKIFSEYIKGEKSKESTIIFIAEAVAYLGAIALIWTVDRYDMLCLIGFAVVCVLKMITSAVKSRRFPKKCIIFAAGIPILLILQTFSESIPYSIVYEHLIITALLFITFTLANEKK